ncbi:hypothetical protein L1049_021915 [Liquidambar formosana]|uniref:RBR-type E3 ubiquitin transferase n=1 Tax=Liquidambar formosana TaxID=63359 RepID=A0AAP0RBT6_LIQFO
MPDNEDNVLCIRCPESDCEKGVLEPEYCRPILPADVFGRWGDALCESLILASQKFYCPFKDCSALLINDGGEVATQFECPNCWRLFCAKCKASWHLGIACAEFQKLNKDEREIEDIMSVKLAKDKKSKRCPKCRFYVEKSEGVDLLSVTTVELPPQAGPISVLSVSISASLADTCGWGSLL